MAFTCVSRLICQYCMFPACLLHDSSLQDEALGVDSRETISHVRSNMTGMRDESVSFYTNYYAEKHNSVQYRT